MAAPWWIGFAVIYGLGVLSAVDAVARTRTPQGAAAWALALALVPLVALPAYWAFGRARFRDYARVVADTAGRIAAARASALASTDWAVGPEDLPDLHAATRLRGIAALADASFTRANAVRLLVDGRATYEAVFDAIDTATDHLLIQAYIVRDDRLGTDLQQRLLAAAARGVRVAVLYDEVGSLGLSSRWVRTLTRGGVRVSDAGGHRSPLGQFRLNFRNHRKVVVADGRVGLTGGLNVGDEYLGEGPDPRPWRDTHIRVEGPAALGLQASFARDWLYATGETLGLDWTPHPGPGDRAALVVPSGPADRMETGRLLVAHAIGMAERRFWVASPYVIPDSHVLGELQAAALRGVDVRVLTTRAVDRALFRYAPFAYLPELDRAGVETWLYEDGFMHTKAFVVDDALAAVGTANLDNRSFRLNFELTCVVADAGFAGEVGAMFEADFARSTRLTTADLAARGAWDRAGTAATRLLAPIL
ncbi:cardiolipin synthase [Rubrivirga sp. IMCC43871]|uniref:cardiolipin synthase n=1 Tax=Rubrivirga sp. IMCC43871 TaxID=3391575 RepID=UPI0039900CE6